MKTVIKFFTIQLFLIVLVSCQQTTNQTANQTAEQEPNEEPKEEQIKHRFAYLAMQGTFEMKKSDSLTVNDPRNVSKLVLNTSAEKGTLTKMAFFSYADASIKLAECGYQYIGSKPDPYYFPSKSKTSIWDVFEKVEDYSGDCSKYKYVISRSPHDNPRHMHLRYGNDVDALLNMSNDDEDENFNPWWATYIESEK